MKKFLIVLGILGVIGIGAYFNQPFVKQYYNQIFYYSYCSQPITYRIDTVDPKFKLNPEKFAESAKEAVEIWNNAYGKTLFVYNPNGDLSVNLIYDERQQLNSEINELEENVKTQQQDLKPQIAQYEKDSAEFKQKLESLNQEIQSWNSQGGAPQEEYDKLTQRQNELQQEADKLNDTAKKLNINASRYNARVSQLNQAIGTFGQALQLRPEEGIFLGPENRIEIYFYIDQRELVHTLTHEFGHALGLDHNNNLESVMYPKTTKIVNLSRDDKESLTELCKDRSKIELLQQRAQQFIYSLINQQKIGR